MTAASFYINQNQNFSFLESSDWPFQTIGPTKIWTETNVLDIYTYLVQDVKFGCFGSGPKRSGQIQNRFRLREGQGITHHLELLE